MTRRRSWGPRRWAIGATALVALAIAGFAIANAAGLTVTGTGVFAGNKARCTNGPIATTPATLVSGTTYSAVSLAALTGCDGLNVQITVFGATGIMGTGSGTAGSNPLVISTSTSYNAANATGVALLVGTWGIPTTWTAPVIGGTGITCVALNSQGHPTGNTCTVSNIATTHWDSGGYSYLTVTFSVTSSQSDFNATVNFADTTSFPGWTPIRVNSNNSLLKATNPTPAYNCSALPTLHVNRNGAVNPTSYYLEATNDPAGMNGNATPFCP